MPLPGAPAARTFNSYAFKGMSLAITRAGDDGDPLELSLLLSEVKIMEDVTKNFLTSIFTISVGFDIESYVPCLGADEFEFKWIDFDGNAGRIKGIIFSADSVETEHKTKYLNLYGIPDAAFAAYRKAVCFRANKMSVKNTIEKIYGVFSDNQAPITIDSTGADNIVDRVFPVTKPIEALHIVSTLYDKNAYFFERLKDGESEFCYTQPSVNKVLSKAKVILSKKYMIYEDDTAVDSRSVARYMGMRKRQNTMDVVKSAEKKAKRIVIDPVRQTYLIEKYEDDSFYDLSKHEKTWNNTFEKNPNAAIPDRETYEIDDDSNLFVEIGRTTTDTGSSQYTTSASANHANKNLFFNRLKEHDSPGVRFGKYQLELAIAGTLDLTLNGPISIGIISAGAIFNKLQNQTDMKLSGIWHITAITHVLSHALGYITQIECCRDNLAEPIDN